MSMSIGSFCRLCVWSLILYIKRKVNALFICNLPQIKIFGTKSEVVFDTTIKSKRGWRIKNEKI